MVRENLFIRYCERITNFEEFVEVSFNCASKSVFVMLVDRTEVGRAGGAAARADTQDRRRSPTTNFLTFIIAWHCECILSFVPQGSAWFSVAGSIAYRYVASESPCAKRIKSKPRYALHVE